MIGAAIAWRALTLTLLAVGLLTWCSSALALSQRGHEHSFSFGSSGEGDGQFSDPSGVAVSEVGAAAGDVYVVDRGNNRVERFGAHGEFISAWGYGVSDGEMKYEICTAHCKAGAPDPGKGLEKFRIGKGQFLSPEAIAVDNSKSSEDPSDGDVYVVAAVAPQHSLVYKFTPTGEFIARVTKQEEAEELGRIDGISVDGSGQLWVDWGGPLTGSETIEGKVLRFNDAEKNKHVGEEGFYVEGINELVRPGFTVDSYGDLLLNIEPVSAFVGAEEEEVRAEEGKDAAGHEPCIAPFFHCGLNRITTGEEGERRPEFGEAFVEELFGGTTTAVAADLPREDVYVDDQTSVAEYTDSGALVQRFGSGELTQGRGVGVDAEADTIFVADAASDEVKAFGPEKAGAPSVDSLSARNVTSGAAELVASVDPTGTKTSVSFQYGPEPCGAGSCTTVTAEPGEIGEGFAAVSVSAKVSLAPGATYHYRVLATYGEHGESTVTSAEGTLTTRPLPLPDDRAWELVSPAAKNGAGIEALTREGGVIQAAEDGNAITYLTTSPSEAGAEGNNSPAFSQQLATRATNASGAPQWSSSEIAIPDPERPSGVAEGGKLQNYQFFSSELTQALVSPAGRFPTAEPSLSSEPVVGEKTLYIRHNEGVCKPVPAPCYTPIVDESDDTGNQEFGGISGQIGTGVHFKGATADLSHVVLSSEVPLTSEPTEPGEKLYEWSETTFEGTPAAPSERLHLVGVLPGGAPASAVSLGYQDVVRNAISNNGERIVFTHAGHLYDRDMKTGSTVEVDSPEAGLKPTGTNENAIFQTASVNGSRVFFTDEQRLTAESQSPDTSRDRDLYEFDVETGKLEDLTPAATGEAAAVQGFVPGASEDGTTVYFVANAKLDETENIWHETAAPGNCEVAGGSCNLFVDHLEGETWAPPQFIATLSSEDYPDWGLIERNDLGEVTSRVSPNGDFLAFMSQRPIVPGTETRDASPGAEGVRAEEVYHFDDSTQNTICVSCRPDDQPALGVFDTENSGEGIGLLVDRVKAWEQEGLAGRWLAGNIPGWTQAAGQEAFYQSNYLTNTGRMFFDSAEALVPADENGKSDVYEYEPDGEGTCSSAEGCISLISSGTSEHESAFLDASVHGEDVFFLTAASLVPSDNDTSYDIYGARECSASSPCVSAQVAQSTPCESESCKPAAGTTSAYAAPATLSASNPAAALPATVPVAAPKAKPRKLTRAQELARSLKACRKLRAKAKRVSCERVARKRYGPIKKKAVRKP